MSETPQPEAIEAELCKYLVERVLDDATGFDAQMPLSEAGVDSFALVEMLMFSERQFGITVPESELTPENLATVAAMARCIHQAAGGGGEEAS